MKRIELQENLNLAFNRYKNAKTDFTKQVWLLFYNACVEEINKNGYTLKGHNNRIEVI